MTTARICEIEPFRYQATAQPLGEENASANQINEQYLEDYLSRMRIALCADIQALVDAPPPTTIDEFIELIDTPDTYAGQKGKVPAVKAAEDGLEFFPTTFTGQANKMVVVKNAENGFELQTQPTLPTYFLTPRLIAMLGPTFATGAFGPTPAAVTGAQQTIAASPANLITASYRFSFTAAAALNSNALGRYQAHLAIRGSGAPMGGFRLRWRFGIDLYAAGARCFIGFYSNAAAQPFTTGNPSALTETIFLGFDAADSTWFIMHNDNAGTCTRVNTTLAINTTSLLELEIVMAPSASSFTWTLHDLSAGTSFTGSPNSDLPQGITPLNVAMQIGSAASGAQNRINHMCMSLEVGPEP